MKTLFTKKIDTKTVVHKLGRDFNFDCIEVIKIKPLRVSSFDLKGNSIIFSSVNAVKSFFNNGFNPCEDALNKNYNKIYCVGEKTKKEVRKNGFGTFKMLKNAKELSQFIIDKSYKESFLHFCGNMALDVLDKALPLQNIRYQKVVVYNTEEIYPKIDNEYDVVVFFSPSGVRSFAKNNSFKNSKLFSIGETTSDEIRKYTSQNIFTSEENSLSDVLDLMKTKLGK